MNKEMLNYLILIGVTLSTSTLIVFTLRKLLGVFIEKYSERLKNGSHKFFFLKKFHRLYNGIPLLLYLSFIKSLISSLSGQHYLPVLESLR